MPLRARLWSRQPGQRKAADRGGTSFLPKFERPRTTTAPPETSPSQCAPPTAPHHPVSVRGAPNRPARAPGPRISRIEDAVSRSDSVPRPAGCGIAHPVARGRPPLSGAAPTAPPAGLSTGWKATGTRLVPSLLSPTTPSSAPPAPQQRRVAVHGRPACVMERRCLAPQARPPAAEAAGAGGWQQGGVAGPAQARCHLGQPPLVPADHLCCKHALPGAGRPLALRRPAARPPPPPAGPGGGAGGGAPPQQPQTQPQPQPQRNSLPAAAAPSRARAAAARGAGRGGL